MLADPGTTPGIESIEIPLQIETPRGGLSITRSLTKRYLRERIFRATLVQHGHSAGEQCLLQAMWDAASPEHGRESRLLRAGHRGLAALCNLNPKSVKANLKSLEDKLAIETVGEFSAVDSIGRTYRIFSQRDILARREAAGMVWVRKIKGVEFIPQGQIPPLG